MKRFAIIFVLSSFFLGWTNPPQACGPCDYRLIMYDDVLLSQIYYTSRWKLDTIDGVSLIVYGDTVELAVGDSINTLIRGECDWNTGPSDYEFKYYRNGSLLSDAPTIQNSNVYVYYTITTPGTYEITHLIKSGLAKYRFEVVRPPLTELPELFQVQVYPNPASDMLWLEFEVTDIMDVEYYMIDITGRETSRYQVNSATGYFTNTINLEQLSAGMYYLVIESPDEQVIKTVVKN